MSRILVVDDHETNRSLLQVVLGRDGHEVESACDGREALQYSALRPPDLVISDLLMPVMDGYALLRRWKSDERLRRIPFVIYTGTYTDPQDQKLADDLGADAYLRKPMEPEEFSVRIRELMARNSPTAGAAREPAAGADEQLAGYNRVLVRKLEEKSERLEKSNRDLAAANERLHLLSQRLLEVQEAERSSLSRELHDGIGQALTAIKLDAQWVARRVPEPEARRLSQCISVTEAALEQVRSIARALRPPQLDQVGLRAALRDLTERMASSAGLEARFQPDGHDDATDTALAIAAFRVAQEALTNVVRHAAARRVTVELLQADGELRVAVRDDGRGFDVAGAERQGGHGAGLGLLGMRERAALAGGWLCVTSEPGLGTRVEAGFPLASATRAAS